MKKRWADDDGKRRDRGRERERGEKWTERRRKKREEREMRERDGSTEKEYKGKDRKALWHSSDEVSLVIARQSIVVEKRKNSDQITYIIPEHSALIE